MLLDHKDISDLTNLGMEPQRLVAGNHLKKPLNDDADRELVLDEERPSSDQSKKADLQGLKSWSEEDEPRRAELNQRMIMEEESSGGKKNEDISEKFSTNT